MDTDATHVQDLAARLDRLEAENQALRRTVDALSSAAQSAPSQGGEGVAPPSISRRRLMVGGGVAAAVGTLAAAAGSSPAAAADEPMVKNGSNNVDSVTSIAGSILPSGPNTAVLDVTNINFSGGTGIAAVGFDAGVRAQAINSNGAGIAARHGGGGTGVSAFVFGDPGLAPPPLSSAGVRSEVSSTQPTVPAFLSSANVTLRSINNADAPPTAEGAQPGDLTIRADGDHGATWWVCAEGANGAEPARFVRLVSTQTAGAFEALPAPIRVYDSRPDEAPATGPKFAMADGFERPVSCTANTNGAVPVDATAVVINLTAANATALGYLAAYPFGQPWGGTSSLNYSAGQNIANTTTVGCGSNGRITLLAGTAGTVDVIVDVIGFYR